MARQPGLTQMPRIEWFAIPERHRADRVDQNEQPKRATFERIALEVPNESFVVDKVVAAIKREQIDGRHPRFILVGPRIFLTFEVNPDFYMNMRKVTHCTFLLDDRIGDHEVRVICEDGEMVERYLRSQLGL